MHDKKKLIQIQKFDRIHFLIINLFLFINLTTVIIKKRKCLIENKPNKPFLFLCCYKAK